MSLGICDYTGNCHATTGGGLHHHVASQSSNVYGHAMPLTVIVRIVFNIKKPEHYDYEQHCPVHRLAYCTIHVRKASYCVM